MFKELKRQIRLYIASQIVYQLSLESPEALLPLVPKLRLALGIPESIGDALPESGGQFDRESFVPVFLERYSKAEIGSAGKKSLDLGCGLAPQNPFQAREIFGCDIRGSQDGLVKAVDLFNEAIPYGDSSFDFVTAFDFVEHIPRVMNTTAGKVRFPFVEFMTDVHRVLKPGALFFARTPAFLSREAFQDPTHVNVITDLTFPKYFCENTEGGPWAGIYGFRGSFELVGQEWCRGWLFTLIRKNPHG